jgi:hypothetical protein
MNDDALFPHEPRSVVLQRLRDLHADLGGNIPIRVLAREAIQRGILTADELSRCQMEGAMALCRTALKAKTKAGLPYAKPTSDGENEDELHWQNLELFTYDEAANLIIREAHALANDYGELLRLHRWCLAKFGKAPEIPELHEPETA